MSDFQSNQDVRDRNAERVLQAKIAEKDAEEQRHQDYSDQFKWGAAAMGLLSMAPGAIGGAAKPVGVVAGGLALQEQAAAKAAAVEARKLRAQLEQLQKQRAAAEQKERAEAAALEQDLNRKGEEMRERHEKGDFHDVVDYEPPPRSIGPMHDDGGSMLA